MKKVIIIYSVIKFKIISSLFLDIITKACYQIEKFWQEKNVW